MKVVTIFVPGTIQDAADKTNARSLQIDVIQYIPGVEDGVTGYTVVCRVTDHRAAVLAREEEHQKGMRERQNARTFAAQTSGEE